MALAESFGYLAEQRETCRDEHSRCTEVAEICRKQGAGIAEVRGTADIAGGVAGFGVQACATGVVEFPGFGVEGVDAIGTVRVGAFGFVVGAEVECFVSPFAA